MQFPAEPHLPTRDPDVTESGSAFEPGTPYSYLDLLPMAVAVLEGPDYEIVFLNKACAKILGRPLSEVEGQPVFEIMPVLRNTILDVICKQTAQTGKPLSINSLPFTFQQNGASIQSYFNVSISRLRGGGGQPATLLISGYDITEQVNIHHQAKATAAQFAQMTDMMPQLVWMAQPDGTLTYYNRRISEYRGARQQPDGSWEWQNMVHPEDLLATLQAWEKAMANGSLFQAEHRLMMADGTYKWHLSRAFPYRSGNGDILQWFGTVTDIDEQKKAAEALKAGEEQLMLSQSQLGMVIHTAGVGTWHRNLKTGVITVSKELERLYGVPENSFPTELAAWKRLVHPDDIDRVMAELGQLFVSGDIVELEYRINIPSGATKWILSKVHGFRNREGRPDAVYGISIDITDHHFHNQQVAEAEERWRIAIEANNMGTWEWNTVTNEITVSPTTRNLLGIEPNEPWSFEKTKSITYAADIPAAMAQIQPVLGGIRETFAYEARHQRIAGGPIRWIRMAGKAIKNGEEKPSRLIGTIQDITAQKESEQALLYQKGLLETVTANTSFALFLMDEQGKCIYINEEAEHLTGYTLEELRGKELHYIMHPYRPDGSVYPIEECAIKKVIQSNRRKKGEDVFIHKNGHFYPVAYTASPIVVNGSSVGTVIEVRDISEERKAAQVLQLNEERFRLLTNTIPQITWISDTEGLVDYVSNQWELYTGQPAAQVREHFFDPIHPEDRENLMAKWQIAKAANQPLETEYRLRDRNGVYRWFSSKTQPLLNSEGQLICWVGAATEVQHFKDLSNLLEEQVADRTRELSSLNQTLQQQTTELQRSNEDLQQFAHIASHDLKEPVRKIKIFGNRLREEYGANLPGQAKTFLQKMEDAAQRIYTLIDGVLEYAQLDASDQPFEPVPVQSILNQISSDLELSIQDKNAQIEIGQMPVLQGIPLLIYQLFYNLINNALKFSRPGIPPVVHIKAVPAGQPGFAAVTVSDEGIGFSPEHAEKIFKTFTRLNSRDQFEGTGLGLALCRKIASRHGGSISAQPNEGPGASFTVILPIAATA